MARATRSWTALVLGAVLLLTLGFHIQQVDGSKDFFDSSEYVWRTAEPTLLQAVTTGHPPFHPGYVGLAWLVRQLIPSGIGSPDALALGIVSAISCTLVVWLTYLIARRFKLSERTALIAAMLMAVNPFLMTMAGILVDPGMLVFLLLALYLLLGPITPWTVLASGFSLGGALFFHTQAGLWAIVWLAVLWYRAVPIKLKSWPWLFFAVGPVFTLALYVYLLIHASSQPGSDVAFHTWRSALKYILIGNAGDHDPISIGKFFYLFVAEFTTVGVVLSAIGAYLLGRRDWKTLAFMLLWIVPSALLASSYIYENLYGRALFFAVPALAMLAAVAIDTAISRRKGWGIALATVVFVLFGAPTVMVWARYENQPSPNDRLAAAERALPGGAFIGTNITKTWTDFPGTYVAVGDAGVGVGKAIDAVNQAFANGKPAYLDSDAVQFPFYRSDGAYYDLRSTQTGSALDHGTQLGELFAGYHVDLAQTLAGPFDRRIYAVTPAANAKSFQDRATVNLAAAGDQVVMVGQLPAPRLIVNAYSTDKWAPLNADNFLTTDPLIALWHVLHGTSQPIAWTATDADGVFSLAIPKSLQGHVKLVVTSLPNQTGALTNKSDTFFAWNATTLNPESCASPANGSTRWPLVVGSASSSTASCFNYTLQFGDTLNVSPTGDAVSYQKGQMPFILAGPYVYLPAGRYTMHFNVSSSTTKNMPVGTIDFVGSTSAKRELTGSDFAKANTFQDQMFDVTTTEPTQAMELRVKGDDAAVISVKSVRVERH